MCVSNGGTRDVGGGGSKDPEGAKRGTAKSEAKGRGGGVSHPQAFQMKKGPTFFI